MRSKKRAFTSFGATLLLILGFVIFFQRTFRAVIVSGPSMLPTLRSGDRVWASSAYWLVGPIKQKDIVVFRDENSATGYLIKRVYFLPGDRVDFFNYPRNRSVLEQPFTIPPGYLYVIGDNRRVSEDSREFGPIEMSRVIGKVVIRP